MIPGRKARRILFGTFISFITYQISSEFFKHIPAAVYAAIITLFIPNLFKYSLLTDSTIYYAVFVSLGLLVLIKSADNKKLFLLASLFAGLAHFTRQDGILLMTIILVAIFFSRNNLRSKIKISILSSLVYLLVLSPLLISNLIIFGAPFAPGSLKTIFLTNYEDIYAYTNKLSFNSYLEIGYSQIIYHKLKMLAFNIYLTFKSLNLIIIPFSAAGILSFIYHFFSPDNKYRFLPILLFALLLVAFHSLVATVVSQQGSYLRSAMALIPFIIVFGVYAVFKLISHKLLSRSIITLVILLSAFTCFTESNEQVKLSKERNSWLTETMHIIENNHNSDDEIVIMTRAPWDVTYTTGYRSVQIPNDDIETIYEVACK